MSTGKAMNLYHVLRIVTGRSIKYLQVKPSDTESSMLSLLNLAIAQANIIIRVKGKKSKSSCKLNIDSLYKYSTNLVQYND